jgi:hypothetical protein
LDRQIRDLERRAKAGDVDAAYGWLTAAGRINDYLAQYQAMMLLAELQHPGLMEQMAEMKEIMDAVKAVEPQPQVEEIWITNNSGT